MRSRTTDNPQRSTHSDQEVLVSVQGVSKKFCRSLKRSLWYGVRDMVSELNPFSRLAGDPVDSSPSYSSALRNSEFWAVNDVSFELRRGECLGLIGRNGAGKTTLLKMLNGLIKPDRGRIEMRGRVGALIALGAGFNPILSGRENIYVNGSVLGLSKREIDAKIEEIIDFADISDFIDSPVQSYSSGMQVRLGFAVATALEPDVLILDEILAVGDRNFQIKCLTRIGQQLKSAAVIFVGHQMERVAQICSQTMVLDKGCVVFSGDVSRGIDQYNSLGESALDRKLTLADGISMQSDGFSNVKLEYGAKLNVNLDFVATRSEECIVRIVFVSSQEEILAEWNSSTHGLTYITKPGRNFLTCEVSQVLLRPGRYRGNVLLQPLGSSAYLIAANAYVKLDVTHSSYGCYPVQF